MTKISDIVSIDSKAVLSNAIQLSWYGDPTQRDENHRLAGGFVFGNRVTRRVGAHTESSSLPLFEAIRDSFGNPQASNIFTVVANYGHGKSHFALVLANFFGEKADAPVIADIIQHIETCSDRVTADHFRNYKKQTLKPHLVVTLSGHEFQDLRQGFLKALRRALDSNEATRSQPIKSMSTRAVDWLKSLSPDMLAKAETFLAAKHDTDVDSLMNSLENFASGNELILRELSQDLFGIAADFGADSNLKEVIKDTVDTYCSGAEAPFHRLLILFDELGIYAEKWCHNRTSAGGLAPQEIFEACSDRRGKVCFVGFVQRELGEFVKGVHPEIQTDFQKWAGRMLPDAVYLLVSNLEEVISKLIVKKPRWKEVISDFSPRLLEESTLARDSIHRYAQTWDENSFYLTVTKDCFPLHPLTTGILCSLDFTQGNRTIIGVVDSLVRNASSRIVNDNGLPRWIRAVELVDEFENSFRQKESRDFASYEHALSTSLTTDAEGILVDMLRALFLFKEVRMTKQNRAEHAEIIAQLAGYPVTEAKDALRRLQADYDAIRYSLQKKEYEFTGIGSNRVVVLDKARSAIVGKKLDGFARTLDRLGILRNLNQPDSDAREFKSDFAVEGDEWHLENHYIDAIKLSSAEIKRLTKLTYDEGKARGVVVNLLSTSAPELEQARTYADVVIQELANEDYPYPFVIGVPVNAAAELEKHLLIKEYLVNGMSNPQRVEFADSYRAAIEFNDKEISEELTEHLRSIRYVLAPELRLRFGNQQKSLDEIADALFAESYKFRAPSSSVSIKPSATRGNAATAEIARQIIIDELNFDGLGAEKQNIVKQVLVDGVNKWGVLTSSFKICEPKNSRVKEAWSLLGKTISKDDWTSFDKLLSKLRQPPFGYDDYTATFLVAAWIGKHKHELGFKDSKLPDSNGRTPAQKANVSLGGLQANLNKSKEFIKYLRSNVSVQHSGQAIQLAARELLVRIQNVAGVSDAERLLSEGQSALQTLSPSDPLSKEVEAGIEDLRNWLTTTKTIEHDLAQYKILISKSDDVGTLLKAQARLADFGAKAEMRSNPVFTQILQLVDSKIEKVAMALASTQLSRVESFDSLKEKLDNARQSLRKHSRPDLEQLFDEALSKVDADHARLKLQAEEQPLIDELNSIRTRSMPLAYLAEQSVRCKSLQAQFPRTRIAELANKKFKELDSEIEILREFVKSIPAKIKAAKTVSDAEGYRTQILRRESLFENTPEQKKLALNLEEVEKQIDALTKNERDLIAARQAEDQIRREAVTAQNISHEFKRIKSSDQKFALLKEMLDDDLQFSDEQKTVLKDLLA